MLGLWQIQRLGEKNALIAKIDARIMAAPQAMPGLVDRYAAGEDVAYTRVTVQGRYLGSPDVRKITTLEGAAAHTHLAPFVGDGGIAFLVERGAVPVGAEANPVAAEAVALTGVLRTHNSGQGLFDPENDPAAGMFYWWDVPSMLATAAFPDDVKVTSLILQLEPDPVASGYPRPSPPKAELRNNHLGYAITWFGLALVLAVMTALFLRRRGATSNSS
jgi:surfeit locus 1 family protein